MRNALLWIAVVATLGPADACAQDPYDPSDDAKRIEDALFERVSHLVERDPDGWGVLDRIFPGLKVATSWGAVVDSYVEVLDVYDANAMARGRIRVALASTSLVDVVYDGKSEVVGPRLLKEALDRRLEASVSEHGLTSEESRRLRLAGGLDLEGFLDRVAEGRREFEAKRKDLAASLAVLRGLEPLRRERRSGLHGEGSLYAKMLAKILAERQTIRKDGRD